MCGIAGMIDLVGQRPVPEGSVQRMSRALLHRGPDEEGFLIRPGLGLASRRLSIVGLADGRQPIFNEDRSVAVVFNGELFDYPEMKAELEGRGHRFATHCDTEIIPHRWEDHQEGMWEHLRGQFAVALYDEPRALADEFESLMVAAVTRRLRADVPVVSYLSGGVDSSIVVSMASKVRGSPIPAFTISIKAPRLDEVGEAAATADWLGSEKVVVNVGAAEVQNAYSRLIQAAEAPVVDTSCAAL